MLEFEESHVLINSFAEHLVKKCAVEWFNDQEEHIQRKAFLNFFNNKFPNPTDFSLLQEMIYQIFLTQKMIIELTDD